MLRTACIICLLSALTTFASATVSREWKSGILWSEPVVITPGDEQSFPSDAIVLFDGKDLSNWEHQPGWTVQDGFAQAGGKGGITTKQSFGDCQLHVEWATPAQIKGEGQGRGNSGIYFMGQYEVQILDSFENKTYSDGQCGAVYKQYPPLVNACKKPGEWQHYDIIFTAPRFNEDGSVKSPACFTVLHNGVLVQNHVKLLGATKWDEPPSYSQHTQRLPLHIQNHGNPVRLRNIWLREIRQIPQKDKQPAKGEAIETKQS